MPLVQAPGEPDFAAFVAIDWADRKHTWALQTACSVNAKRERSSTPRRRLRPGHCSGRRVLAAGQ